MSTFNSDVFRELNVCDVAGFTYKDDWGDAAPVIAVVCGVVRQTRDRALVSTVVAQDIESLQVYRLALTANVGRRLPEVDLGRRSTIAFNLRRLNLAEFSLEVDRTIRRREKAYSRLGATLALVRALERVNYLDKFFTD